MRARTKQPGDQSAPCLLCGQRGTYPVGFTGWQATHAPRPGAGNTSAPSL